MARPDWPAFDVEVDSAADGLLLRRCADRIHGTWSVAVAPGSYTLAFSDDSGTYASGYLGKNGGWFTYDPTSVANVTVTSVAVGGERTSSFRRRCTVRGTVP